MAAVRRGALAGLALLLVWLVLSGAHFRARSFFSAAGLSSTADRGSESDAGGLRVDRIPQSLELEAGSSSPAPNSPSRVVRAVSNSPFQSNPKEPPELTSEDRKIWQEMLKDLPPSARRDVLEVRKRLGHLRPSPPGMPPDEPTLLQPDEQAARPAPVELLPHAARLDEPDPEWMLRQTRAAIAKARAVTLNNISNLNSIGYKREVYSLESAAACTTDPSAAAPPASQAQIDRCGAAITVATDTTRGRLRQTGQMLDLAIDGPGYFQLADSRDSKQKTCYFTRCGRFSVDREGHLILRTGVKSWLLIPPVTIPGGPTSIDIDSVGAVRVVEKAQTESQIGCLQTAAFVDSRGLIPVGGCVYRAVGETLQAALAQPATAGHGRIRQGFLEESNAKLQEELENLQQLAQLEQALEQAAQTLRANSPASSDALIGSGSLGSEEKSGSPLR